MRDYLEQVKQAKTKAGKGQLVKYLSGIKITRGGAIKAKCYDCDGFGDSGECDLIQCPLYPFSPYKTKEKKA